MEQNQLLDTYATKLFVAWDAITDILPLARQVGDHGMVGLAASIAALIEFASVQVTDSYPEGEEDADEGDDDETIHPMNILEGDD